jgi:NAD(P)-dependent dehydrogenase (short-subunit alcohol dehydrogenase family)
MRAQNYGRIVMTTSSSGLYGNFGQSNYAAAKMALIGLMNALHLEGAKNNVRVNAVAPAAATRMTEELLPDVVKPVLAPENVAPGVLTLVHEDAPSRCILCAGAGSFAVASVVETQGAWFNPAQLTPEQIVTNWMEISKTADQTALSQAGDQTNKFIQQAIAGLQTAE